MSSNDSPTQPRQRVTETEDSNLDHFSEKYEASESAKRRQKIEARKLRLAKLEEEQKSLEQNAKNRELLEKGDFASVRVDHLGRKISDTSISHSNLTSSEYASARTNGQVNGTVNGRIPQPNIDRTSEYGMHRINHQKKQMEDDYDVEQLQYKLSLLQQDNSELETNKVYLTYEVEYLTDLLEEYELKLTTLNRENREQQSKMKISKFEFDAAERKIKQLKDLIQQKDSLLENFTAGGSGDDSMTSSATVNNNNNNLDNNNNSKLVKISSKLLEKFTAVYALNQPVDPNSSLTPFELQLKKMMAENTELAEQLSEAKQNLQKLELESESSSSNNISSNSNSSKSGVLKQRSMYRNKEEILNDPLVSMYIYEIQDEAKKEIAKCKLEMSSLEQDNQNLKLSINRIEGTCNRYKEHCEFLENAEDELKTQKRQLQRDNRMMKNTIEELSTTRDHLEQRLQKMRQTREKYEQQAQNQE